VDDLEGVLDDSDGHDLLAVVSAVHHEGVDESLDDWALGLSESFNLVSAASMWKILGVSVGAGQVILEGDVVDRDVVGGPSSEELDRCDFWVVDVFLSPISFAFHGYILRSEFLKVKR